MAITLIIKTLKFLSENSKFPIPFSRLHTRRETLVSNPAIDFILDEIEELHPSKPLNNITQYASENAEPVEGKRPSEPSPVQISHPWPEWVQLMNRLMTSGYFDEGGNPLRSGEMDGKNSNQIRTACLNFARDRADLIRYLSKKSIQAVVGSGCPIIDRKVVNSGKRLRAHLGIDEGNVCSSCTLRGNCERAYAKAREAEGGRTVDVMRLLLTYGLDHITGLVENKPTLNKRVKESIRRLLKEMVEFSMEEELDCNSSQAIPSKGIQEEHRFKVPMKQGDWRCPKCNFLNFARNIKCLRCDGLFRERPRQSGEDQDHLRLKKGDWICEKCNFLNFSRNTRCTQCKEKPPKRQLNPGEWECDSCNYINFRRNMICLKCDYKRPKASNAADSSAQLDYGNGCYHHSQRYFGQG